MIITRLVRIKAGFAPGKTPQVSQQETQIDETGLDFLRLISNNSSGSGDRFWGMGPSWRNNESLQGKIAPKGGDKPTA
jgi:uncharacterized protein with LGFP repeats